MHFGHQDWSHAYHSFLAMRRGIAICHAHSIPLGKDKTPKGSSFEKENQKRKDDLFNLGTITLKVKQLLKSLNLRQTKSLY